MRAEVDALRAGKEAPDQPEALATLPQPTVADIGPAPAEPGPLEVGAPLPCVAHELDTHGIDYVYHYFDLRHLDFGELPYAGVLSELLGRLATARHSASDLDTLVETNLGGLDFFVETYTRDDDLSFAAPTLVVGASALSEKAAALSELPREVWGETDFGDLTRIRDILTQRRVALEQYYLSSGRGRRRPHEHVLLVRGLASGAMGGLDYYLFLRDVLEHWDERAAAAGDPRGSRARRVFTAGNVTVSFTGPAADRELFWERGGTLGLPPAVEGPGRLVVPAPGPRREAFVIPSDVAYVARAGRASTADAGSVGAWQGRHASSPMTTSGTSPREGRAYGVGFKRTTEACGNSGRTATRPWTPRSRATTARRRGSRGGGRPRGSSTATSWPRSPPTTRPSSPASSHVARTWPASAPARTAGATRCAPRSSPRRPPTCAPSPPRSPTKTRLRACASSAGATRSRPAALPSTR